MADDIGQRLGGDAVCRLLDCRRHPRQVRGDLHLHEEVGAIGPSGRPRRTDPQRFGEAELVEGRRPQVVDDATHLPNRGPAVAADCVEPSQQLPVRVAVRATAAARATTATVAAIAIAIAASAGPSADADGRLLERLDAVRSDSRTAIREVRRIVDNLGSPALDELGLAEALRIRAARTTRRADGSDLLVQVEIPADLPRMPAAVELAVYRIATEALTNVVRHSSATTVRLRLVWDGELRCEVLDDGAVNGSWRSGVGISSMRERAAELGGRCDVGSGPDGGHVRISLPVAAR